jgi:hypothetical protein
VTSIPRANLSIAQTHNIYAWQILRSRLPTYICSFSIPREQTGVKGHRAGIQCLVLFKFLSQDTPDKKQTELVPTDIAYIIINSHASQDFAPPGIACSMQFKVGLLYKTLS